MSLECVCKGAGHCALFGRAVTQREYELCSCTTNNPAFNDPVKCAERRKRWLGNPRPAVERAPAIAPRSSPLEWISTAQLARDAVTLAGIIPLDVAGIVGVPRSGLIPASIMATYLHLPLYELTDEGSRLIGGGRRTRKMDPQTGRLAVVDDTVYSGKSMRQAREILPGAVYAAVYVRPEAAVVADLYARLLPSPHLLEWNLANNGPFYGDAQNPIYGKGMACDLDGVICHDAESGGKVGTPYLVPRFTPCPLIVTGRYERHRAITEAWLRQHGVSWDRLAMLPDDADVATISAHKAKHYAASSCGFLVESDPGQAAEIHRLTQRPVICPRVEKVWYAEPKPQPAPIKVRSALTGNGEPAGRGPGTELQKLLESVGVRQSGNCGCKNRIRLMDAWGPEGCRQHRERIIEWLRAEQKKAGWGATLLAAARAAKQGLWLSPADPLGALVDEAIRRSSPD